MQDLQSNKKHTTWRTVSIVLMVLILASVAGAVWYYQTSVAPMVDEVSDLKSERDSLKTQLNEKSQTTTEQKVTDKKSTTDYTSKNGASLTVTTPIANTKIGSPLTVSGTAPGNWFSEGIFDAVLQDSNGTVIATGSMDMPNGADQTKPVSFTGELHWTSAQTGNGILVLKKANPSGLDSNTDSVEIAVKF